MVFWDTTQEQDYATRTIPDRYRPGSLPPRPKDRPGHAGEPTGPQRPFRASRGMHTARMLGERPVWPYVLIAACLPVFMMVLALMLHLFGSEPSAALAPSPVPGPEVIDHAAPVCPTGLA